MLYDLIHNSIWGTISLISGGFAVLYAVLYIGLGLYNYYYYRKSKCSLKILTKIYTKKDGKARKIHFVVWITDFLICIITFVLFLFMDFETVNQDYSYIRTSMAEQKKIEMLFEVEETVELNENEDMRKLHIEIDSPLMKITEEEIEDRIILFGGIYKVGTEIPNKNIKLDSKTAEQMQELRTKVNGMKSAAFSEYQEEFEAWSTLFENMNLPSDLYQSSRAARDMIEVGRSECDGEELLRTAAEAVYRGEIFLGYENRNINTEEVPVIIEADDMLFYNGKVFYQLYLEAETREELNVYKKEFIVNAYVCMVLAEKAITEEDAMYAMVNYYIGNIEELMLEEILEEDSFYGEIVQKALEHYRIALSCLENRPDYYDKEWNMQKNCQDGIVTLGQ